MLKNNHNCAVIIMVVFCEIYRYLSSPYVVDYYNLYGMKI